MGLLKLIDIGLMSEQACNSILGMQKNIRNNTLISWYSITSLHGSGRCGRAAICRYGNDLLAVVIAP
jgi:hypothetical protein